MQKVYKLVYDELKHKTDGAYLFVFHGEERWIPRSLCKLYPDDNRVLVQAWFVTKNALEVYIDEES